MKQEEIRQLKVQVKLLEVGEGILQKPASFYTQWALCQEKELNYSFIARYKKTWQIGMIYRQIAVNSSGFYHCQKHIANNPKRAEYNDTLY